MTGAEGGTGAARVEPVRRAVLVAGAGALGSVVGGLLAARGWPRDAARPPRSPRCRPPRGAACRGAVRRAPRPRARLRHRRGGAARPLLHHPPDGQVVGHRSDGAPRGAASGAGWHVAVDAERPRQSGAHRRRSSATARVLGARVIFGAEIVDPGPRPRHGRGGASAVGSPDPDDANGWPRRPLGGGLAEAGIPAEARRRSSPSCGRRCSTTPPSIPWARCSACRTATCRPTTTPAPSWTTSSRRPSPSPAPRASVWPGPTPRLSAAVLRPARAVDGTPPLVDVAGPGARPADRDRRHQRPSGAAGAPALGLRPR